MKSGRQWAAVGTLAKQLRVRSYIGEREARQIIKQAVSDWSKREGRRRRSIKVAL
jgi:hypothetical protein